MASLILLRTDLPIPNRSDVWGSEVRVKTLTPARRDKLVALLNMVGFVLKGGIPVTNEIVDNGGVYEIGVE